MARLKININIIKITSNTLADVNVEIFVELKQNKKLLQQIKKMPLKVDKLLSQ